MKNSIVLLLSFLLVVLIGLLLVSAAVIELGREGPKDQPPLRPKQTSLPTSSFTQNQASYDQIGKPSLQLEFREPKIPVPDLRPLLNYHGSNARPDAGKDVELIFTLGARKESILVKSGSPTYLKVEGGGYQVSRDKPTDLWFVSNRLKEGASIDVFVKDEEGNIQKEPKERAHFIVAEKPLSGQIQNWKIGTFRVDGTLLARQKARWSGRDLFLEEHGGKEFESAVGRQRVVFGEGESAYSLYMGPGDFFVWKDEKWQVPSPGEKTQIYPLLAPTKIDERIMSLLVFDPQGTSKVALNLVKMGDPLAEGALFDHFQFVGARTRVHSTFKIDQKREIVGPEDWFIETADGWKKIKTAKEIDQYVAGVLKGPLLVIHQIEKDKEGSWLAATLYNASRSSAAELKIPLAHKVAPSIEKAAPEEPPEPQEN